MQRRFRKQVDQVTSLNNIKIVWLAICIIVLAALTCSSMTTEDVRYQLRFDLQGHRGCRGLMPENTIPAFIEALELGVNTLEMDAVITADQQVILSHEPFFNHEISTKENGDSIAENEERSFNIYKMNYAETMQFDVGLKPHPRFPGQKKMTVHKPLLKDVFDAVIEYCNKNNRPLPFFNIETKSTPETDNIFHPAPKQFVALLLQVIREKCVGQQVILQSFDFRTLKVVHSEYPDIKTAALVEEYDSRSFDEQLALLGFQPAIYSPAMELVTAELIEACHAKNVRIIPWTVNEIAEMKRLIDLGVDGLITDYPDRFNHIKDNN